MPTPPATPASILQLHSPVVRATAEALRRLVREVVPEAVERTYPGWHAIGYRHPRAGYFCGLFPQEHEVRLLFEWGVLLADSEGLLQPGGKQVRYVPIASPDAIPQDAVVRLLLEAVAVRSR